MVRCSFELQNGQLMEYELFRPTGHDKSVPAPFVVSISGCGQSHVNHFSRRLVSEHWVLAVPLRPDSSPPLFEGRGSPGDGIWHVHEFCRHLTAEFAVSGGSFLMAGVSNGGSTALRFATLWPRLCHGLIVVTGSIQGLVESPAPLLRGIPIDMYCGSEDECGFFPPMKALAAELREAGQSPPAMLTVFEGAGHCCSPLVDSHLLHGKIWLMMVRAAVGRRCLELAVPDRDRKPAEGVLSRLANYSEALGLKPSRVDGKLVVANPSVAGLDALVAAPAVAPEPESCATDFALGSLAEVWSNSKGRWVRCTVTGVSQEGVAVVFSGSGGTQLGKTIPLQLVHENLRKLDTTPDSSPSASPDASPTTPKPSTLAFVAGDSVDIWSASKQRWFEDGKVIEVERSRLLVTFNGGSLSKWILVEQLGLLVRRRAGQSEPAIRAVVEQLQAIGFTEADSERALAAHGWDLNAALDGLLSGAAPGSAAPAERSSCRELQDSPCSAPALGRAITAAMPDRVAFLQNVGAGPGDVDVPPGSSPPGDTTPKALPLRRCATRPGGLGASLGETTPKALNLSRCDNMLSGTGAAPLFPTPGGAEGAQRQDPWSPPQSQYRERERTITPPPCAQPLAKGDRVVIWSESKGLWFPDGQVIGCQADYRVTVTYSAGSLVKEVALAEQPRVLRRQEAA